MAYNMQKVAAASEDIKAKLLSGDSEMMKTAGLAASEYFRVEIRENGIRRQITLVIHDDIWQPAVLQLL